MKKILLLLLLIPLCSALEFNPSTVDSMDVTITTTASGSFSGNITSRDEMKVMFLTIQKSDTQEILSLEEYMQIGNTRLRAFKEEKNGLTYATYTINDLLEFANENEFIIVRKARIKTQSQIGLGQDYNLAEEIKGFDKYINPSDYIESNDAELKSKTALEFSTDSQIEAIRKISEWVNNNITYDFENYYSAIYSAKHTYNTRAGVCDEFANLTAAFMRIKGIPARYVSGISYDGERFGSHGWLEVFLPTTGWIEDDSTYGEAGFVDGAHFSIAKSNDANSSADLIISTKTREEINVISKILPPECEIHSVHFFENLLDAKIKSPEETEPLQIFEVSASIKNTTQKSAIFPIELVLHDDFLQLDKKERLVYLQAGEEKEIIWEISAPQKELNNSYYTYGMLLLMPDSNLQSTINLVPKNSSQTPGAFISVEDVSPFIEGEKIEIQTTLQNRGLREGEATIELSTDGNILAFERVSLKALEQKTISLKISAVPLRKIIVTINTQNSENKFELTIPQKESSQIEVREIRPLQEQSIEQEPSTKNESNSSSDIVLLGGIGIGLLALIIAAIAIGIIITGRK